jgi:hypothetical protein
LRTGPVAGGGGAAHGEFVQVGLAHKNGARLLQPARYLGVLFRNAVVEDRAGGGRPDAHRVNVVFEGDGNAVQRAAQFARALFGLEIARFAQGFIPHDRDEGVQLGVVGGNAVEACLGKLRGSDRPRPNAG